GGGPDAPDSLAVGEVYDEGDPGEDQFVELYNPKKDGTPIDLSVFYLSVLETPTGEGTEYGLYDLTSYDDDGLLEADEFLIVTSDQIDLGSYKRIGVYNKSDDLLIYETGWSHKGEALDPVNGLSTQLPWDKDNEKYIFGAWTIAPPTKAQRNVVSIPDFDSSKVVINEVNNDYVELYNTGGSDVNIGGYKLAGHQNAYPIPGGEIIEAGGYYIVTLDELFIASSSQGGDMKLLNELGVLVDVITYNPDGSRAATSSAARHFDGLGERGVYTQAMGEGWNIADQENEWWEFGVEATKAAPNYDQTTILIDGVDVFDYYNASESTYKGGIVEASVSDYSYLANWDVIMYNGDLDDGVVPQLTSYLNDGGRLYIECDDYMDAAANEENFYDMLHIQAQSYPDTYIGTNTLTGDLFAEGIQLGHGPSVTVRERINPLQDAFRVMYMEEAPRNRFVGAYIENPTTGYRVVSSGLQYSDMTDAAADDPSDYLDALLDWFLDPDLNNAPALTLLEGQAGTTPLVDDNDRISALGWTGWENGDADYWDQDKWQSLDAYGHEQYKFIEFTFYLDADSDKV
ncbi:MAG: lamin tail domain-containing protein, partial [Chloroflexi bacterium]|nr:lamin tail domain-containing protein [Chloroflexota bacterium]